MKIVNWKSIAVVLASCALTLALPAVSQAGEVDLDEPVTIKLGMGVAVFSTTFKCSTPISVSSLLYVKWRAVGGARIYAGDGRSGEINTNAGLLFGTEELSKSPRHVWGRLAGLSLPPGTYEFYGFRSVSSNGNRGSTFLSERQEFSRRFSVEPDKVQYVGSLDICTGSGFISRGGMLGGFLIGAWVGGIEVFPSLHDDADLDLPILFTKGNGLTATDVSRNVAADETDRHMQELVDDLRRKSGQGDIAARRHLLLGLINGWGMTETGEKFKVLENRELQWQLAEQLAAQDISGGAYALGLQQAPALRFSPVSQLPVEVDGTRLLNGMVADAGRYFLPAMTMAANAYRSELPGVAKDIGQATLWEARERDMNTLDLKSLPYLDAAGKTEFRKFDNASMPRYFALSASGAYGMSIGEDSSAPAAITACEARNTGATEHCRLYAENHGVVWDACPVEYAGPQANVFPPTTGLGKITDTSRLPTSLGNNGKTAYRDFLELRMPRAFAVADSGEIGMANGDCHAAYKALQVCNERSGKTCQLYALDDQIVLGTTDPKLVEQQQRLTALLEQASQGKAKLANQSVPAVELLKN